VANAEPVITDRTVGWCPMSIKTSETYDIDTENEFLSAGVHPSELEGITTEQYDQWADQRVEGRVTQIKDGLVFIHLDKPFCDRFWTVAYGEATVAMDPALSEVADVWGEWIDSLPTTETAGPPSDTENVVPEELHLNGTADH
jgi:hypothetical protein